LPKNKEYGSIISEGKSPQFGAGLGLRVLLAKLEVFERFDDSGVGVELLIYKHLKHCDSCIDVIFAP